MRKPTQRQKDFVHNYLAQGLKDATGAAVKAGFSEASAKVTASRMLANNAWVRGEIEKRRKALAKQHDVTENMVIEGLLKEAQREGEGSSHSARVSAWEKIGRNLGMFDKVEPTPPAPPPVNVTNNVNIENVEVELRVGKVKDDLGEIFDGAIEGATTAGPK